MTARAAAVVRAASPLLILVLFWGALRLQRSAGSSAPIDGCGVPSSDVSVMERCLATHPDDVETMIDLGRAYEAAHQAERAEAVYRRALAVDPLDADVHLLLGSLLLERGDASGAAHEADLALRTQPGSRRALDLRARAAGHAGGR